MSRINLTVAGCAACIFAASQAAACESGVRTYSASGTYNNITYTAVRVDWDASSIYLKSTDGTWVNAFGATPAEGDPVLFEAIVESMIQTEVTTNC